MKDKGTIAPLQVLNGDSILTTEQVTLYGINKDKISVGDVVIYKRRISTKGVGRYPVYDEAQGGIVDSVGDLEVTLTTYKGIVVRFEGWELVKGRYKIIDIFRTKGL